MFYTELRNLLQRNPIKNLRDNIWELTSLVNDSQITQRGENQRESIIQSNDEYTLTIFKNGLNEKVKTLVSAAKPTTFLQATHNQSTSTTNQNKYNINSNRNSNRNNYRSNNLNQYNTNKRYNV